MRVVVLFNQDQALAHGGPQDAVAVVAVLECARAVERALRALGHEPRLVAAPEDPEALLRTLRVERPDVIFNLVESCRGDASLEPAVVGLLELGGVPFTGNGSLAGNLALRKSLAKTLLAAAGVPVAPGVLLASAQDAWLEATQPQAPPWPFPWIVKPSQEDASHGIGAGSVVFDLAAARARVAFVIERYRQPALVERFIEGRELNAALLGDEQEPELLPLAEIDFSTFPVGRPRLVTYESKWVEGSPDWNATQVRDADLSTPVAEQVRTIARRAWRALSLRGYGRVDLRLDRELHPFVLEVNPNPDLSPDAGFARAWGRTGRTYDELIAAVVAHARSGPQRAAGGS